jgi:GGDEF domain-containing protein
MIGRIGGDEFTIWINFLDNNKEKASIECET